MCYYQAMPVSTKRGYLENAEDLADNTPHKLLVAHEGIVFQHIGAAVTPPVATQGDGHSRQDGEPHMPVVCYLTGGDTTSREKHAMRAEVKPSM
jgi:hypothetical protein